MRLLIPVVLTLLLCSPAWGLSLGLSVTNNSRCGTGDDLYDPRNATGPYNPSSPACSEVGTFGDDNWARLSDSGNTSDSTPGPAGTVSNEFEIDAAVAVGAWIGNDEYQELNVSYELVFTIDTNHPSNSWSLVLDHHAAGLLALHGDGPGTAVGTQDDGHAQISAIVLSGDASTVLGASQSLDDNPSNTNFRTQEISRSATGVLMATGMGDATLTIGLAFTLDAFSNDGCSGFLCSSATGGEEAAVLFGLDDIGIGVANADEYDRWGRAVGPDGYRSTWTLTAIPEPGSLVLIGMGLVGLAHTRRRRV